MTSNTWRIDENRIPSREEIKRLAKACRERAEAALASGRRQPVVDWMMLHLLIGSGLRSHEVAALHVKDLQIGHGQAAVHIREGKGGKPRLVAISWRLKNHLRRYLGWKERHGEPVTQEAPVFVSEQGTEFTTRGIRHLFKRCLRQGGLSDKYGVHAIRHFHLSALYESTKDLRLTQEQAGHASVSTTQVYTHVSLGRRQEAVDKLF
ncbi:MAG: tyrosine-type recombinase/integrase [Planctomycetota bacterium]|nr:tyrosine-type recombinase/integrase [Planctomycetota bacterium]